MPLLPFVSDDVLRVNVMRFIDIARRSAEQTEAELYRNVIDPFSAVLDAGAQGLNYDEWIIKEKARQVQKTLQNCVGEFHQSILAAMPGWEDLRTGNVVDLRNTAKQIVAEVKNKFNTTKGNHMFRVYDDLTRMLTLHPGFVGYYVEVIPRKRARYNVEFTPSDNQTHETRPPDRRIRKIDGQSFYEMASGQHDALKLLFDALPVVIHSITGNTVDAVKFSRLFDKAYRL